MVRKGLALVLAIAVLITGMVTGPGRCPCQLTQSLARPLTPTPIQVESSACCQCCGCHQHRHQSPPSPDPVDSPISPDDTPCPHCAGWEISAMGVVVSRASELPIDSGDLIVLPEWSASARCLSRIVADRFGYSRQLLRHVQTLLQLAHALRC